MRKSQIQGQVFVYILALLVMSFVLIYGYRAVTSMESKGNLAALVSFKIEIKRAVSSIRPNYGSVKIEEFVVPSEYREVCFIDLDSPNSVQVDKYPIMHNYVDSIINNNAELKNVFLLPPGTESDYVGNITVENDFLCFSVISSRIKVKFEGLGNLARVSSVD